MTAESLLGRAATVLEQAAVELAGSGVEDRVQAARSRLDEPLRVALAGRVKAGKSTLLNGLVGEELAPTDDSECTRVVTWYVNGLRYAVTAEDRSGASRPVRFRRLPSGVEVDLESTSEDEIERLLVEWPSEALRRMTLIDTPGLGSLSPSLGARAEAFLLADDDSPATADAVVYLMRHLHPHDLRFLEAFTDGVGSPVPVNAIGVLSRADEVGGGRLDALASARGIAARCASDLRVRKLCQTVVPVAGLLAQAAVSLTEDEHRVLRVIAGGDDAEVERLLLSADRLAGVETSLPITPMERGHVLERMGLFGVRWAVAAIRGGEARSGPELAEQMLRESGLPELRRLLQTRFGERADILKVRSALATLVSAVRSVGGGSPSLAGAVEALVAGAHELVELRLLNALLMGTVALRTESDLADAIRLLGGDGLSAAARLGLSGDAGDRELQRAAQEAVGRWQRVAESPLSTQEVVDAARVVVRSCEGIAAAHGH